MLRQYQKTNPAVKPDRMSNFDAIKQAHVSIENKANLLKLIWRKDGPVGVLSVGEGVKHVNYDPVWRAAIRSETPDVLFHKWGRFETFAHSHNRVKIDELSKNSYRFTRHTVTGGVPSAPENLLICGLLIALLEQIGCQKLLCHMNHVDGSSFCLRQNGNFINPPDIALLDTTNWTIKWDECVSKVGSEGFKPEDCMGELLQSTTLMTDPTLKQAMELLMCDVSRIWQVEELAHETGLSKRSLQRKLNEAHFSFSHLIRLVRIDEACRLLEKSDISITVVGFCSGFSDSAHFSRDFRASMGMTPSDYRDVSC